MSAKLIIFSTLFALAGMTLQAALPVGYYSFNGTLLETFDSMGPLGTTPPLGAGSHPAWIVETPGIVNPLTARASLSSSSGESWSGVYTGYNGGGLVSNDRALGLYRSASGDVGQIITALRNDTGSPVSSLTLTYDLELWASRTNNRSGGFGLFYSLDGTTWTAAGSPFAAVLSIATPPLDITADRWLSEPVAQRGIGGTLNLTTEWQPGQKLYLRWDNRSGPGITASNRNIGSFIDNLAIAAAGAPAPVPPGQETTTSFRASLAADKTAQEQVALLNNPAALAELLKVHATANVGAISISQSHPPSITFRSASGLSGVCHIIEITSDLQNGPWEEIARFNGSTFTVLDEGASYEIHHVVGGLMEVIVRFDSELLGSNKSLFFRRVVMEEVAQP